MSAGPRELPGGRPAYRRNRRPPIPCRATVQTSISGQAAGRMSHATFRRACGWSNASSLSCASCWPSLCRARPCTGTANIWVLGGEIIRQLQMDCGRRRRPIEQIVLNLIDDDGGPLLLPRPVRSRATLLRRDLPQALSLPDKPPKQPQPQRSWFYRSDEPTASLTAPMQTTWPCVSPSSPAAAQRCAAGAGLDGDPRGQSTIGRAVR